MPKLLLIVTPATEFVEENSFVVEVEVFGVSHGTLWHTEENNAKNTFYAPGAWLTAEEVTEDEIEYEEVTAQVVPELHND